MTTRCLLLFIPMESFSLWTFGVLMICSVGTLGLDQFPDSFLEVKRNDPSPVRLSCDAQTKGSITWRFNGEKMEEEDFGPYIEQQGSSLILSEVDTPMLGEYSCWEGQRRLSTTYLFLEDEDEVKLDSLLRCRATSYDCNFTCSWTDSEYTAVRLGVGPSCARGERSCNWITTSAQHPYGGTHFLIPHSISPYGEESVMLELTAEAIRNLSVLRRVKRFYLRDIVQPDSPQIVKCQKQGQKWHVIIDPPSTWSIPYSFFPLEHEIEYTLKDNGKNVRTSSSLIPQKISKLRARSRDPFVVSLWSPWTPWKNVTPCDSLNQRAL